MSSALTPLKYYGINEFTLSGDAISLYAEEVLIKGDSIVPNIFILFSK